MGRPVTYSIGVPGRHIVNNSLAVLAAAAVLGIDIDRAAAVLAGHRPGKGRGERLVLRVEGGSALLIDESYNANPASMRAALAVLHTVAPAGGGERIAVLGDMLELGENETALHAGLAEPVAESGADRVYLAGPRMKFLWEALPPDRRAVYAETAAELESALVQDIGPGDVVMIKGSNGSRMGPLVESLKRRFATPVPAGTDAGV
jgi:UDP-N-acetylmuramyl pentapeptide synthase